MTDFAVPALLVAYEDEEECLGVWLSELEAGPIGATEWRYVLGLLRGVPVESLARRTDLPESLAVLVGHSRGLLTPGEAVGSVTMWEALLEQLWAAIALHRAAGDWLLHVLWAASPLDPAGGFSPAAHAENAAAFRDFVFPLGSEGTPQRFARTSRIVVAPGRISVRGVGLHGEEVSRCADDLGTIGWGVLTVTFGGQDPRVLLQPYVASDRVIEGRDLVTDAPIRLLRMVNTTTGWFCDAY